MQTVAEVREKCQQLPGSQETFPFDAHTLVMKAGGKVYALLALNSDPLSLSLKCDPERAETLRGEFEQITPGYHLNKRHWNTLRLDGTLPADLVSDLLLHSYALVVASLTRAQRAAL
ncbi:MmcQ/YjbR family DNA-binding protein [Deinococcus sp. KNUC1210]|uniref:MmcQ/YjbR family DNA-binding protein n=1 Tax=Deinococcus sp. KNUC1210 TaxID=2917691 RepID=UPI001EF0F17D|nr:MmcQ/YjbR family DNA-binding protein [Deinococcus sp. KNUC1210]ULH14518.1 MmcQ/YjbR family DNA-binding protein [Deinococcus sp. KNUC1210]